MVGEGEGVAVPTHLKTRVEPPATIMAVCHAASGLLGQSLPHYSTHSMLWYCCSRVGRPTLLQPHCKRNLLIMMCLYFRDSIRQAGAMC